MDINFVLHPEYYKIYPHDINDTVKGLYISCNALVTPHLVTDTLINLLNSIFKEEKPACVLFKKDFHMYLSPMEQYIGQHVNHVATSLLRLHFMQTYGQVQPEVVFGNAIIFGTKNLLINKPDGKDHSVPYQIIEQTLRIYDGTKYYKAFF